MFGIGGLGTMAGGGLGFMAGGPMGAMIGANIGGGFDANEANLKESARNRRFQETMSNSAHQREVQDLRAAGLNPILSAGGGGASTPSGSTAQQSNIVDSSSLSTALGAQKLDTELGQMRSSIGLNQANTAASGAAALRDAATAKSVSLDNITKQAQLPGKLKHAEYDKNLAPVDAFLKRAGEATSAINNVMPKIRLQTKPQPPPYTGTLPRL